MAIIHVVHALPSPFLPEGGQELKIVGGCPDSVSTVLQDLTSREWRIESHVRYEDFAAHLTETLGVAIPASATNCPSPFEKGQSLNKFLLASRQFDGTVKLAWIYDSANESADHAWRYEMTKYA